MATILSWGIQFGNAVNSKRTTQSPDENWIRVLECWALKGFVTTTFFPQGKKLLFCATAVHFSLSLTMI